MRKVLAFIFAAIFIGSTAMAVVTMLRYKRAADELTSLAEALPEREAEPLDPVHVDPVKKEPAQTELATEAVPTEPEAPEFHRYDELYAQNPDLFGWIQIEGTVIDYPVMHTPDKPEKYLRKNFEGEYSVSGLPFMDAACYEGCGNYLVYGHHMSDKSMFATLLSYKDKEFWQEHQVVNFDLVTEPGTYQIFAVFYDEYRRQGANPGEWYGGSLVCQ